MSNSTGKQRLPWHESHWRGLEHASHNNRISHAYLLAGPPGLGKRRFAMQLAQALLCANPLSTLLPCGECHDCTTVLAGSHPDFIHLGLSEDSKVIKIDDVREYTRRLYLTSEKLQGKVSIIDPADALNSNAANALLKTLEEPPAGVHIIMVADRLMQIPATIRSRCQLLRFSPPDDQTALAWLHEHADAAQPELRHARSAPLLALAMAENGMAKLRQQWLEDLDAVCLGKSSPMTVADRWQKEDLGALLGWLQSWLSDLSKLKLGAPSEAAVNASHAKLLQSHAQSLNLGEINQLASVLTNVRRLLDTQANLQLVLENLLASWYQGFRLSA